MKSDLRVIQGQASYRVAASTVEAMVTQTGGHVGPVTYDRNGRRLQPMAVAPWAEEAPSGLPAILQVLRGDFFCMPFGGNAKPFGGETHPVHGETANAVWHLDGIAEDAGGCSLRMSLATRVRRGRVEKLIRLEHGHNAVYCRHVISGMKGPMCLGHHAMLRFPDRPGSGVVTTSPFVYGQTLPEPTERPENRGYSLLKPGAVFTSLNEVPTVTGEWADLGRYPARRGYEDLAMIVGETEVPFGWTAVTFPRERYAWFALKDPRVLRSTLLWHSNGGRHYPPWNGRHVNVLGLEEVTSYFHYGLAESARMNPLSAEGHPTSLVLHPDRPLTVNYIMALAVVPAGFESVAAIEVNPDRANTVILRSSRGKAVNVVVDVTFLSGGLEG